MASANCDIGLIGLAVMGQNLVLNMNDHGYKVAVFNRTTSKVDEFLADEAKGTQVEGEMIAGLKQLEARWKAEDVARAAAGPLALLHPEVASRES